MGPYEHHSNELPWRETIADVVVIGADADGHIDLADLAAQLDRYAQRPLRIGSFSAASNVTGILSDTDAIAALLHARGALSFWDYAAAGPYVPIRARESAPGAGDHKDAIFLSPHKFIGGPQTPGVLVVRRDLVRNRVPTVPGGGTVAFVDPIGHRYLDDPVAREEGGTPAIVESIRAGLVFALKQAVGTEVIQASEERLWKRALHRWSANPQHRGARQPRTPAGCRSSRCASATATGTCTTTTWSRCSTTCSGSRPAAAAPAPARTATGCWPSARPAHMPSAPRSATAARASSPAGPGSTSTTSSPAPSPATSSTPST